MRILVAEDDPFLRRMLEVLLPKWGYQPTLVEDGEKALKILQTDDAPKLAILDWLMPGMDGIQVCRSLRSSPNRRYTYLLMLTSMADKERLIEAMDAGTDDYISKPFDERELQCRLRAGRRIIELEEALRVQADRDPLTGMFNRRAILEALEHEASRSRREGKNLAVLMLDVDHFKQVNDKYGHLTGDQVLREVSRRMRHSLRDYETVGRYGGEEFLAIVCNADENVAHLVAERIRVAVSATQVITDRGSFQVTISIGAACAKGARTNSSSMISRADVALYQAKSQGRNRSLFGGWVE
jgi:two-component system, cell cycle response regulator